MKKENKLLGATVIIALMAIIGFSMTACGDGAGTGDNGTGGNGTGTGGDGFSWNGSYFESGTTSGGVRLNGTSLYINNSTWDGTEIHGGTYLNITIVDGGVLKLGNDSGEVIGRYAYINFNGGKKGLLAYYSFEDEEEYALGLGTRTSPADGARGIVASWYEIYFSPSPDLSGMPTSYYWIGGK